MSDIRNPLPVSTVFSRESKPTNLVMVSGVEQTLVLQNTLAQLIISSDVPSQVLYRFSGSEDYSEIKPCTSLHLESLSFENKTLYVITNKNTTLRIREFYSS